MVSVMQHASNGSPAAKGIRIGDKVRTPNGLLLTVTSFNLAVLTRAVESGWPTPPPPPRPFAKGWNRPPLRRLPR